MFGLASQNVSWLTMQFLDTKESDVDGMELIKASSSNIHPWIFLQNCKNIGALEISRLFSWIQCYVMRKKKVTIFDLFHPWRKLWWKILNPPRKKVRLVWSQVKLWNLFLTVHLDNKRPSCQLSWCLHIQKFSLVSTDNKADTKYCEPVASMFQRHLGKNQCIYMREGARAFSLITLNTFENFCICVKMNNSWPGRDECPMDGRLGINVW